MSPTRRRLLATGVALGSLALAGCAAPAAGDIEATVQTVDSECASGDSDTADATFADGEVEIEGTLGAPNPCHEAVIDDVTREGERLSAVIGIESTDEMCIECIGRIDYRARIDPGEPVATLVVNHVDGERHRFDREES